MCLGNFTVSSDSAVSYVRTVSEASDSSIYG
jgi:hypothetical protein